MRVEDNDPGITLNGFVYHIKGNSQFKEFINLPKKDKLIMFHANFCSHCTEFMPKFEELAQEYRHYMDDLVFAKIDITKNDIDFKISAYPTFYYFKSS